jgi:hypothetical protein
MSMKSRFVAVTALLALVLASSALAQSSRGSAEATIGGEKVAIDYGQPKLGDRELGELMKKLPPDRIWRAGENQVTTLTTGTDLMIGGTKVPAGKYSVYVHAGDSGGWSFILNKDLGVPLGEIYAQAPDNMKNEPWPHLGGDYTKTIKDQEVVRAEMKAAKSASPTDPFTMSFTPSGEGADLTLAWGDQAWKVDIKPAK